MKKQDYELKIKSLTICCYALLVAMTFLLVWAIYLDVQNDIQQESLIQEGMNQAEYNCAKLLCEKNNCSTIQVITQVQNYCKSLVYGTDFYMRLK